MGEDEIGNFRVGKIRKIRRRVVLIMAKFWSHFSTLKLHFHALFS